MANKLIWTDEDKFFITTFNKRLYDDYAYKFLQTYAETNQILQVRCYQHYRREQINQGCDLLIFVMKSHHE